MTDGRRALGAVGEDAAARWYEDRGYEIIARNWRIRGGELDIVTASLSVIVFCEVKTRSSDRFGSGFAAVTFSKQQKLRSLALAFLAAHPTTRRSKLRFDVASVKPGGDTPRVEVIEAAF